METGVGSAGWIWTVEERTNWTSLWRRSKMRKGGGAQEWKEGEYGGGKDGEGERKRRRERRPPLVKWRVLQEEGIADRDLGAILGEMKRLHVWLPRLDYEDWGEGGKERVLVYTGKLVVKVVVGLVKVGRQEEEGRRALKFQTRKSLNAKNKVW